MTVSVIVPFYDETAYLRTALGSIRNQPGLEVQIIVVNDNPDRFSPADLEALVSGFDVEVLHHPLNLGLSAARNTGLAAASGTWIGFLDADDYYLANGLSDLTDYASATGADMTHGCALLGREGQREFAVLPRDASLHSRKRVVHGLAVGEEAQFIVSSWSSLYRRDFLLQNGLRFDTEQRKFEDRLFVLNAVTAAETIAFYGKPVRVWRRRANSISTSQASPETHVLQVQLLEKCLAHMRAQDLPDRFYRRELFNCVSRLIWDIDMFEALATNPEAPYPDLRNRLQTLLGEDSFGQSIFDDNMVRAVSRVGRPSRIGRLSRVNFFAFHKAVREGDFAGALAIRNSDGPTPKPTPVARHEGKTLILHVGLHKTGSTYLQHHLSHYRSALKDAGILVPETGFETPTMHTREGALSGHQGLLRAMNAQDKATWDALHAEIAGSNAQTVLISAENMAFPTAEDRADRLAALTHNLGAFDRVEVIALVRRADVYAERFHAEWATGGHPSGNQTLQEFLVQHAGSLTDLPALFEGFETWTGHPVKLGDFDRMIAGQGLWRGFSALADLPDLPEISAPRYPTPDRDAVRAAVLLNRTNLPIESRRTILAAMIAAKPAGPKTSGLSPAERIGLLQAFQDRSADFAAARGYVPDTQARIATLQNADWTAPDGLDDTALEALMTACAQVAYAPKPEIREVRPKAPAPKPARKPAPKVPNLPWQITMRPWARKALRKTRRVLRNMLR